MDDTKEHSNGKSFVNKLIEKETSEKLVISNYTCFKELRKKDKPFELLNILSLPENYLKGDAYEIYSFFEFNDQLDANTEKYYNDFKWKLSAFISLQDIFDSVFYENSNLNNIFQLWYFYYESKYILIESILSGFNGFTISSSILLRLFIEFNILQNYFYRLINNEQDYKNYNKFLEDGILPNWNVAINRSLPKDNFCKPIKIRLDQHLKGLSKSSVHPYHPINSPKQYSSSNIPEHSLEGIFFWHGIRYFLDSILWLYYINFPMLFHPVNILNKFGFNFPMGVFIDENCSYIIKKTLSNDDYEKFKQYSEKQENVSSLKDWYSSRASLSEKEILDTWNHKENGEIKTVLEGYVKIMAETRAMKEMMALKRDNKKNQDIDNNVLEKMMSYSYWKKIYKAF